MRVRNFVYLLAVASVFATGVATSDQVKSAITDNITAYANTAIANNPVNVHVNQNTSGGGGGKNNNNNNHKNNNKNNKNNKKDKKQDKKDIKLDKKDIKLDKKDIKLDKNEKPAPIAQAPVPQAVTVENNNNNQNNNTNVQHVVVEQPQPEIVTVSEGGQPVYEAPTEVITTPSTGAESLPLLGLLPTGLLGAIIRKKIASLPFGV